MLAAATCGHALGALSQVTLPPPATICSQLEGRRRVDRRVRIIIALMETEFHRERLLREMARLVNLSPSRFHQLFKDETGAPPYQYLKALRLGRARELLETTFLSVKQVMASAGLKNKSHFVKDFKKTYGMTPTEYRRALASRHEPENRAVSSDTK
jgi:transcriptional regulator GlxA family with amidase domain